MGYVLRLSELKPLIEDLLALGLNVVVALLTARWRSAFTPRTWRRICRSCSASSHSITLRSKRSTTRGMKNRRRDVVEGFRVLTLTYRMDELPPEQRERLEELFRRYRAIASLYYWSKRLRLKEGLEQAVQRARELIPYYWRKALDEKSPLYVFSEVEKMKQPRKQILKLPLVDALHPNCGAFIDQDRLVVRLGCGQRLVLPVPERALRWLKEKEGEVAPLKPSKTVLIQWRPERAQAVKVQIRLRVERPQPPPT